MMNKKLVEFIKNFSIVMMGNVYSIFISVIVTFLIPRSFGKEAYSYFQLENLYCGYVWIMSLGWNDGLYIKFGGEERKNINKSQISSQIAALTCYLSFMGICLAFIFGYAASTNEKRFVLWMALTSVIIEIITISIINIIQVFGAGLAIIMLVILGIQYFWVTPTGKAEFLKKMRVYILGAIIIFAATGLLQIVKDFINKNINEKVLK